MKIFGNICKYFLLFVLCVVLAINLYFIFARLAGQQQPKIFGFSSAVVLSGSMEPEFYAGDLLIFQIQSNYVINDIIIFNDSGALTTHRIVEINADGTFTTKGDNNNSNDTNPVDAKDVHGKMVLKIAGVGAVISFLTSPLGLILIVILAFCILALPQMIKKSKQQNE